MARKKSKKTGTGRFLEAKTATTELRRKRLAVKQTGKKLDAVT